MKSLRGRLLVSLLAGPLFLGAAEAVLSVADWPPPFLGIGLPIAVPYDLLARSWRHAELDPALLFRLRPGTRRLGVHPIDSLGLVGPEASRERSPGTVRVVCLGDSTTFGIGEVPGRSYPDLLRGMCSRAFGEGRVEVLNAGLPTYTSTQCLRRFLREIVPLRPDVVVAYHGGHN
ncbi:MAG TPA: GDSL-type esterase/lipase family protein, partial [Planctomycetota bacterium]|nr:GDSL-type esterase/lipase family protein [Planctomycetota bacterium]